MLLPTGRGGEEVRTPFVRRKTRPVAMLSTVHQVLLGIPLFPLFSQALKWLFAMVVQCHPAGDFSWERSLAVGAAVVCLDLDYDDRGDKVDSLYRHQFIQGLKDDLSFCLGRVFPFGPVPMHWNRIQEPWVAIAGVCV